MNSECSESHPGHINQSLTPVIKGIQLRMRPLVKVEGPTQTSTGPAPFIQGVWGVWVLNVPWEHSGQLLSPSSPRTRILPTALRITAHVQGWWQLLSLPEMLNLSQPSSSETPNKYMCRAYCEPSTMLCAGPMEITLRDLWHALLSHGQTRPHLLSATFGPFIVNGLSRDWESLLELGLNRI